MQNQSLQKTDIVLPGDNWVIKRWVGKSGSLVTEGETLAILCTKDAAIASKEASNAQSPESAAAKSSHKRPNRRKRLTPTENSDTASKERQKPVTSNSLAGIQQRLAQKLSSENKLDHEKSETKAGASDTKTSTTSSLMSSNASTPNRTVCAPVTGMLRIATHTVAQQGSDSLIIGFIEECSHPTFLDGLCVVCGTSTVKSRGSSYINSSSEASLRKDSDNEVNESNVSRVTVSGGVTMTVSENESRQIAQQDTDRLLNQAKLALVLDLDHTLVHATADPRARQFYEKDDVRTLRLPTMEGTTDSAVQPPGMPMFMQHFVKLRPHIKTFLESVQPDYELTVYTAGTRQYAEEITIVLCRHMVGSTFDIDDLERLRHQVQTARLEYRKVEALYAEKSNDDDKKRYLENNVSADSGSGAEPPSKKRKAVSFGVVTEPTGQINGNASKLSHSSNLRSDHITKDELKSLEKRLQDAESLEKQAFELRQKLFGSRVVSRTDVGDLGRDVKSLKRIFPCGGKMAAVVDDREDVWANASNNSDDTIKGEPPSNLLLVKPYHWDRFVGFADVNNAAGEDLSGTGAAGTSGSNDFTEKDVQLVWTARILRGLHRRYYRQDAGMRKSVPELLSQMRSQVLKDASIVLSGLVPLHKQSVAAGEARPPIIRYAQSMGAQIMEKVGIRTTHVVASKDGTDKCLAAKKIPGCILVKASWLVECYWSMTRRDTQMHLLHNDQPQKGPSEASLNSPSREAQNVKAIEVDSNSDASLDSQDDDFAAAFEEEMMNDL